MRSVFLILLFLSLVNCISIPSVFGITQKQKQLQQQQKSQNINLVKHSKSTQFTDYHSLIINNQLKGSPLEIYNNERQQFTSEFDILKTSAILITRDNINKDTFKSLGLLNTLETSKALDISHLSTYFSHSKTPISIPVKTKGLFLFNTDSPIEMTREDLIASVPFNIDTGFKLLDYSLLIPTKYLNSIGDLTKFLNSPKLDTAIANKDILFFNSENKLKFFEPLLIALFEEDHEQEKHTGVSKLPFADKNSSKKSLFEMFALSWFKAMGSFNLVHSVFCSVNNVNNSVCVQVSDSNDSIEVVPTFINGLLNYNGMMHKVAGPKIQQRDLKNNSRLLQPQFNKFSTLSNFTRLNYNVSRGQYLNLENDSFKAFKIQVSNPSLFSNLANYKNVSLCNEEDAQNQKQQQVNQTNSIGASNFQKAGNFKLSVPLLEEDLKRLTLHHPSEHKVSQPRSPHFSQVIFPNYRLEVNGRGELSKRMYTTVQKKSLSSGDIDSDDEEFSLRRLFKRVLLDRQ